MNIKLPISVFHHLRDHSFRIWAKLEEKLTFLTLRPIRTRMCAYQGVRNVNFSENFMYALNGSPLGNRDLLIY